MTIILNPEQEQAIRAAINAGIIRSADELIDSAIARLPLPSETVNALNLFELFEPVRGLLTDEEIDRCFVRNASPGRPTNLT